MNKYVADVKTMKSAYWMPEEIKSMFPERPAISKTSVAEYISSLHYGKALSATLTCQIVGHNVGSAVLLVLVASQDVSA